MPEQTRGRMAAAVALCALVLTGCDRYASLPSGPLKDDRERVSYAYGQQMGEGWAKAGVDLQLKTVGRGMDDGLTGRTRRTTAAGAEKTLLEFNQKREKGTPTADEKDSASYAFGYRAASTWRTLGADVDVLQVLRGVEDARAGRALIPAEQRQALLSDYYDGLMVRIRRDHAQLAAKNRQDGEAFLKKNRSAPGVVTLSSGLQYKVLASGRGEGPAPDGFVGVVYENQRLDGTAVPDTSGPNHETVLAMGSLIKGWQEALSLMKPGDRWQLFIPSDLAYGPEGDPRLGPDAALITTMDLRQVFAERPPRTPQQIALDNRD